mgnify:CR=1 FL=1
MKNEIQFIFIVFFIMSLLSCSKEASYEAKIINNTDYHLNNIKLGCTADIENIEVKPNSTSGTLIISYETGWTFSERLLCTTILSFSDTTKTYENTNGLGGTNSMSDFKEGQINYININLDPNFTDSLDIFSSTIN